MGRFLTQKVRMEQCHQRRYWHTLDNELYKDDDGTIYIVPRHFKTDNFTIPSWVAFLAGSPVDFRVEPSHVHDIQCDFHKVIYVILTEEELKEKGYLRFSEKRQLWVCENIPKEFLATKPISKAEANNMLWRSLGATSIPMINRILIRAGVTFNIGWIIDSLLHRVPEVDLDRFYDLDYWEETVPI